MTRTIGASSLGHPCDRNVYYSMVGAEAKFSEKSLINFATGTALEPVIVMSLEMRGWKVFFNPGSREAAWSINIPRKDGVITGHPDAVCLSPTMPDVWLMTDLKTMHDFAFRKFTKSGTYKAFPQYGTQISVYTEALINGQGDAFVGEKINPGKVKSCIAGFNKLNSSLHTDILDHEQEVIENAKIRADYIFTLQEEPVPEDLPSWACNYCGYRHLCEIGQARLAQSKEKVLGDTIDDSEVEDAAAMFLEAKDLKSAGAELEKDARALLDKKLLVARGIKKLDPGVRNYATGSYEIRYNTFETSRFDKKGLGEKHPDLLSEFTKKSTTTRIDVKSLSEQSD